MGAAEGQYLFQATPVLPSLVRWAWLVGKWYRRELVLVVRIPHVLYILEDWVEIFHSFRGEETNLHDETLNQIMNLPCQSKTTMQHLLPHYAR